MTQVATGNGQEAGAQAPAGLLSIATIRQAAEEIARFKPLTLTLGEGRVVTVRKLPGLAYREALTRFVGEIIPLVTQARELSTMQLIALAIERLPGFVDFLIEHGTDIPSGQVDQLTFDELVVLGAAVISVTFVEGSGTRCFFSAVRDGGQSVIAEIAAAQQ